MRATRWILSAFLMAAVLAGPPRPLSAGIIAADDFESYALGQLEPASGLTPYGGSGWSNSWNVLDSDRARVQVVARSMVYSAGSVQVDGGSRALQLLPGNDTGGMLLLGRTIASQTGTVYLSFLLEAPTVLESTGGNTTDDFLQIGMDTSFANPRISGGVAGVPTRFFARTTVNSGSTTYGANVSPTSTYLVVLKFSGGYNRADVFINPTSVVEGDHSPTATFTGASGISSLSDVIFRTARHETGLDWYYIDNVTVGTTFSDVVPVPEPAALALALMALMAFGVFFLRRGSAVREKV